MVKKTLKKYYYRWYVIHVYPYSIAEKVVQKIYQIKTNYIKNALTVYDITKEINIQHEFVFINAVMLDEIKKAILDIDGVSFFFRNNKNLIIIKDFNSFIKENQKTMTASALKIIKSSDVNYTIGKRIFIESGFLKDSVAVILNVLVDDKLEIEIDFYNNNIITVINKSEAKILD